MNQAEVVRPEVESYSGLQIGQFEREGQCEPVKLRNFHPQRQILPLHIGDTDLTLIGNTQDFSDFRSRNSWRDVASRSGVLRAIEFRDDGVGRTIPETLPDGRTIRSPRVGINLRRTFNASAQIGNEDAGINRVTFADMEGGDELRFGVQGNVGVLATKFRIAFSFVGFHHPLFLANERPDFITLDRLTANPIHHLFHHYVRT